MNIWKRLIRARRKLSITTKFTFAFVTLLLLIVIVALTGFVSLNAVQSETKDAIDTGIEVQRQVFRMDAGLKNARQLERDFFLRWQTMGFSGAYQQYALGHQSELEQVQDIRSRLQERLTQRHVSAALRQSNPDLVAYAEIVEQYAASFREAVGLVRDLGIENVGLLAQLDQNSARLSDRFKLADTPELMVLYLEMQSFEKQYLLTPQEPKLNSWSEATQRLRRGIIVNPKLGVIERTQTSKDLDAYDSVTKQIVELNKKILSKILGSVDVDAQKVSNRLIGLANAEVERARTVIDRKIQTARLLMISAVVLALIVASGVAKQFASALGTLAVEKAKSERLLLNILPAPIAQQLKESERTIADSFPEVTVLFADIVGFTELAAQTPAIELVEILNVIFSEFDQLTDEHGLEKIKTIGDAYMVVGGLPAPKPNHAEAIAAMALDMQDRITEFCTDTGKALSIRIGINTGPVIAGIIGTKKFIYDLWGDTVNIASRMESHGIPGSIQVTEATYQRLKQHYVFEERGPVQVKGKGKMNCYLLKGEKKLLTTQ
ncbi:MAG TPA: adenylate/guanylate cyclase domain-containing protein [Candidatus Sericytochromatia bacterium]